MENRDNQEENLAFEQLCERLVSLIGEKVQDGATVFANYPFIMKVRVGGRRGEDIEERAGYRIRIFNLEKTMLDSERPYLIRKGDDNIWHLLILHRYSASSGRGGMSGTTSDWGEVSKGNAMSELSELEKMFKNCKPL